MTVSPGDEEPPHVIVTGKTLRAGTAAVLAALAAGETNLGALGTAFLAPPMLAMLEEAAAEIRQARQGRIAVVLQVASDLSDQGLDELLNSAMADPERQMLLEAAIEAGADAHTAEKIYGLGRALANGLVDDPAALDLSMLIVKALGDLETGHVRLLARLERDKEQGPQWLGEPLDRALRAVLARHYLIENDTVERQNAAINALAEHNEDRGRLSTIAPGQAYGRIESTGLRPPMPPFEVPDLEPRWTITLFGSLCLDYLQAPMTSSSHETLTDE